MLNACLHRWGSTMRPAALHLVLLLLAVIFLQLSSLTAQAQPATPRLNLIVPPSAVLTTQQFEVRVMISRASNMGGFQFDLAYDPERLTVSSVTMPDSLGATTGCNPAAARCMIRLGPHIKQRQVSMGAASYGNRAGLSGDTTLAIIRLQPTGKSGVTALHLTNIILTDVSAVPTLPPGIVASVVIKSSIYLPFIRR
jgi:hypothetical protein